MTTSTRMTMVGRMTTAGPGHRWRWITLAVLCVTLLLVSIDNTILNVALPSIVRGMHATSTQLQWIVDAYAIVFAGLLLPLGALGDRVGRKWVYLAGLAVFGGGSALAAWSASPDRLTIARAVMGIGAAALMPCTLSILTNVFTSDRERVYAIGFWSGAAGIGVALGPILGGFLLVHYWWGSVFLINVPIAAIALIAAVFLVPNSRNQQASRPDVTGALLSMAGFGLLLFGIIEAPNRTWTSPVILGALAGAAAIIATFIAWERHTSHPMLPLRFFRNRRYTVAISALAMVMFALLGMFFLITQYLQFAEGYSPLRTGLSIAPVAAILLVIAPLSAILAKRFGTKPLVGGGLLIVALGFGILSRTTVHGGYGDCLPAFLVVGLGVGLALAPSLDSIMGSLPKEEAGVGSATSDTSLQIGGALGVAVLGTLLATRYQNQMTPLLVGRHIPAAISKLILGSLGGALAVAERAPAPLGSALANTAKESFISGMDLGLIVAASVAGVAGLIVLAMLPNRPRTQKNSLGRPSPHLNEPPKPGEHRTPDLSQGREPAHLAAATTYASHNP